MAHRTGHSCLLATASALLFACSCNASRETKSQPSAKASVVSAEPSALPTTRAAKAVQHPSSAELDQLIALSKTKLGPEEKRTRLQAALGKFPEHSKER